MLKPVIILFVLLLLGYLYFNIVQSKDLSRQDLKKLPNTTVDVTQDYRALGYTGQKKLVADQDGNIYLAYRKKTNGRYEVFVAKLQKNDKGYNISGIDKSVSNVKNGAPQRVPSLAIDQNGILYLVWYGADSYKNEGDRQVKFSKSDDQGKSWNEWRNISQVPGFNGENLWQEHPDILTSSNGNLYVVWEGKDKNSQNQQIKFSKSTDMGETWTQWLNIKPSDSAQSRPTILEASGKLYVFAYGKINSPQSQIYLTTSSNQGQTWSSWQNLSKSVLDARHVSATVNGKNILAVWREGTENLKSQLYYCLFDGKSWEDPKLVSPSSSYQFFPQTGLGKSKEGILVWTETNEESDFPNDDPEEGIIKSSVFDFSSKSFKETKEIAKEAFYPIVLKKNTDSEQNLGAYLSADDKYKLILTPLP